MYEVPERRRRRRGRSPFVLAMDDSIAIEPDSILRAVREQLNYAANPIIVGGPILNLRERFAAADDGRSRRHA